MAAIYSLLLCHTSSYKAQLINNEFIFAQQKNAKQFNYMPRDTVQHAARCRTSLSQTRASTNWVDTCCLETLVTFGKTTTTYLTSTPNLFDQFWPSSPMNTRPACMEIVQVLTLTINCVDWFSWGSFQLSEEIFDECYLRCLWWWHSYVDYNIWPPRINATRDAGFWMAEILLLTWCRKTKEISFFFLICDVLPQAITAICQPR